MAETRAMVIGMAQQNNASLSAAATPKRRYIG